MKGCCCCLLKPGLARFGPVWFWMKKELQQVGAPGKKCRLEFVAAYYHLLEYLFFFFPE